MSESVQMNHPKLLTWGALERCGRFSLTVALWRIITKTFSHFILISVKCINKEFPVMWLQTYCEVPGEQG